jgi:hypothetical protein
MTPGPKPDLLKIKGGWRSAIKKSFQKKKTSGGLAEITARDSKGQILSSGLPKFVV